MSNSQKKAKRLRAQVWGIRKDSGQYLLLPDNANARRRFLAQGETMTTSEQKKRIPRVRIARPKGRAIQLRYTSPETGKEHRISTGTLDEGEALEQKQRLEAKLLLGIATKPAKRTTGGPTMDWTVFRERYTELQLSTLRAKTVAAAESRLDIAERILKPRTLADVANGEALCELQSRLLAGDEGKGPRAAFTVRNYMAAVVASLNWASTMGWLASVPKLRKVKVAKLRVCVGGQ